MDEKSPVPIMHFRLKAARVLGRLGRFISSLALMVPRPQELVEFGRKPSVTGRELAFFGKKEYVEEGLRVEEAKLVERMPLTSGRILVLDMGGGREAIALAKMGFSVVGADSRPDVVAQARSNAVRCGVPFEGVAQDFAELSMPEASFDAVIFFSGMYSSLPTRARRIAWLTRVRQVLRPGGYFLCLFFYEPEARTIPWAEAVKKALAVITRGNLAYERGDALLGERSFQHVFRSQAEAAQEFEEGGFAVVETVPTKVMAGAVLKA